MGLEFSYPWALLALPLAAACVWWIDRRYRLRAPSLKRRVTLGARLLLAAVLALALAAPSLRLPSGQVTRWILLDVSDSAKQSRSAMESAVSQALEKLPQGEKAGVIAFGNGAMVEVSPGVKPVFSGAHTAVKTDGSDIDDALLLANALLPADGGGSLLVIGDDNVNVGKTAASVIAARGIPVDGLVFAAPEARDAQLSQLVAPAEVYQGQGVTVEAVIDANGAMSGSLALYQNGELISTREVELSKGENRFAFRETAEKTGVATYEARLMIDGDAQSKNDRAAAYVRVSGAPNLLVISESEGATALFRAAGMETEALRPAEMPETAEDYLRFDGIVLNNVDYEAATKAQWDALIGAVRTLGRGLCVLGGDSSYALGGYRGTELEELLPVTIDVRNKLQMPSLSLVIAIDKSGSMTEGQFGTSRVEVAKEAAISALDVLTERDYIGVIGFDDTAKWVAPFQQATDPEAIRTMIGTLRADGGTAFYSALQQSLETLLSANTAQKHVIFLSDGQPGDAGFEDMVAAMRQNNITLTTVAVGSDADARLMRRLATIGGGRSYQADEFSNVPKIFAKETMLAGGSYVQNRVFTPVITEASTLTDFAGFPALSGYLTATEKATATVSLESDTGDPLLARWNAGAGKALCWMSDAEGAWTGEFLRWEDAAAFFGGMAAIVMPGAERFGTLSAAVDGETMKIVYETEDAGDNLPTEAVVVAPSGQEQTVALHETQPGVYEGTADAGEQGAYALRASQTDETGQTRAQESGAVKNYAREYDLRAVNEGNIAKLAEQTGGRRLDDISQAWEKKAEGDRVSTSLQGALLIATLCLLLLDIALRKLGWDDAVLAALGRKKEAPAQEKKKAPKPAAKAPKQRKAESREEAASAVNALLDAKKARRGD